MNYEKTLNLDKKNAFVFNNLGTAYLKKGDLDNALEYY